MSASALALFPLHMVLFPGGLLPLRIFETRYVDMVRTCMRTSANFGVVLIRAGNEVGPAQVFEVGTAASIVDFNQLADGFLGISCLGTQRFRIKTGSVQADGLNLASVEWLNAEPALSIPARHGCCMGGSSTRGNPADTTRAEAILPGDGRSDRAARLSGTVDYGAAHRARLNHRAASTRKPQGTSQSPSSPSNRPTQSENCGVLPRTVASCSMRSTTTQPA